MKKRRITIIGSIIVTMIITMAVPAFASAPKTEDVEYLGSGKVEVEFTRDVRYSSPSVSVKDSSGKYYSASIYYKDSDEVKFKIKNYKAGKTYKYTIKKVRVAGTSSYGNVYGSVKIPSSVIGGSRAIQIAVNDAAKKYGIRTSSVWDRDYDSEGGVYEVDFKAKKSGSSRVYEYEYRIGKSTGKVYYRHQELDD